MIKADRLAEWLSRLVQIPSVSPDQAGPRAGVPGEAQLAAAVANWFQEFGGEVHRHEVLPGRPNIYGIWRGRSERWAVVDVHLDTVSVEEMSGDPFSGQVQEGRVYGRGAVDTKASLGVILALLEQMRQAGQTPASHLLIAATVDEEVGARGAPAFANWMRQRHIIPKQLAVAEPTLCTPVYGHKGISRVEFHIQGKAAHSSQPELGQNAIMAAVRLIEALDENNRRQIANMPAAALGPPTLTIALIQGGSGINVVPESCRVALDRRVVDGEDVAEVTRSLHEVALQACPLPLTMAKMKQLNPFFQSPDTPWLRQLAEWSGQTPTVAPYGTNAWAYGDLAQECVVIGPGSIDQAHSAVEWVAISELEKLADIYARWWGVSPEA
jgi:acetylornithine deacetylase/succinyl-diaminopimelate desuccinylase-like protein